MERIVIRERNIEKKMSSFIWRTFWTNDSCFPFTKIRLISYSGWTITRRVFRDAFQFFLNSGIRLCPNELSGASSSWISPPTTLFLLNCPALLVFIDQHRTNLWRFERDIVWLFWLFVLFWLFGLCCLFGCCLLFVLLFVLFWLFWLALKKN